MSYFRRVKTSHLFVTHVKNSFKSVTNSNVFVTHVKNSFTSVKNSNVFVTHVKNSCELFTDMTNTSHLSTTLCCEKKNVEETSGCS